MTATRPRDPRSYRYYDLIMAAFVAAHGST